MRKLVLYSLLLLISLNAFGHAGEVHTLMGTITMTHTDGSFMMKKTDGKTVHVGVTKSTVLRHLDGHPAKASEVVSGKRVSVTFAKDAKTATIIKIR
jgi:hypothetical protein